MNAALEEKADLLWYIKEMFQSPVIGQVPEEEQFVMQLRARMEKLRLICYQLTASYRTGDQEYRKEWRDLTQEPFVLCVNGRHEVVIV